MQPVMHISPQLLPPGQTVGRTRHSFNTLTAYAIHVKGKTFNWWNEYLENVASGDGSGVKYGGGQMMTTTKTDNYLSMLPTPQPAALCEPRTCTRGNYR